VPPSPPRVVPWVSTPCAQGCSLATTFYQNFEFSNGAVSTSTCAAPGTRVGSQVLVSVQASGSGLRVRKPAGARVNWLSFQASADKALESQPDGPGGIFQCNGLRAGGFEFAGSLLVTGVSNLAFTALSFPQPTFANVDYIECNTLGPDGNFRLVVIDNLVVELCPA
jgi:hypothetical protein